METRTCKKCGELKPLTAFYHHVGCLEGRVPVCKDCVFPKKRPRFRRVSDVVPDHDGLRTCLVCGVEQPLSEFKIVRGRPRRRECRSCRRPVLKPKPWSRANRLPPDVHLAHRRDSMRRYYKTEKGRANKQRKEQKRRAAAAGAVSSLTRIQWDKIQNAYGGRCAYCRCDLKRATMDHVVPVSRGGAHAAGNVVPACRSCNSKKCDRRWAPWIPLSLRSDLEFYKALVATVMPLSAAGAWNPILASAG